MTILTVIAGLTTKWVPMPTSTEEGGEESGGGGVLIFIPCYSESEEALRQTVNSVLASDYSKITICVVVDGIVTGAMNAEPTSEYAKRVLRCDTKEPYFENDEYYIYNGEFERETTTVIPYVLIIKKKNYGKKDSLLIIQDLWATKNKQNQGENQVQIHIQEGLSEMVDLSMITREENEYLLMLDTDTIVDVDGISILVSYLRENIECASVCGETLLTNVGESVENGSESDGKKGWLTWSLCQAQKFEYWITHKTMKAFESCFGEVLVMSGCFALYRRTIISDGRIIDKYRRENDVNLMKANVSKFGEDRYLTNLILMEYPKMSTKYVEAAKCYTECPEKLKMLYCQRRRWTNSMIFCHVNLLLNLPNFERTEKMVRFLIIIFWQLWSLISSPILLMCCYGWMIVFISDTVTKAKIDVLTLVITVLCLGIPTIQCFVFCRRDMIVPSLFFILFTPIYNVWIPLYSFYHADDIRWGQTREVVMKKEFTVVG